jgi:hypothetical protein
VTFRLTVIPPDGEPVQHAPVQMKRVAVYGILVVLMNADPNYQVNDLIPYLEAREFAERFLKSPRRWEIKHGPTGFAFSIDGQE